MPAAQGEAHYRAQLTDDDVREIRRLREGSCPHCGRGPMTFRAIGDRYGISAPMVHHIVSRRAWSHVE